MTLDEATLADLVREAIGVLDEQEADFRRWLGSPGVVHKGPADFATQADLAIEDRVTAALADRTGLAVHGEERGGPDLATGTAWVVDPVDGTLNYSQRVPLTGLLLALLHEGQPVAGFSWLPLLDQRWHAVHDGLWCNGEQRPALTRGRLSEVLVSFGALRRRDGERYPDHFRFDVLRAVSQRTLRVRVVGSTAIDLAWTAGGVFGGAVVFGDKPWDNAAGVCLVRAAGGVVTDLAGEPWRIDSPSVLAGAPGVHDDLLETVAALGDPDSYPDLADLVGD